jgi:hypothetical protein
VAAKRAAYIDLFNARTKKGGHINKVAWRMQTPYGQFRSPVGAFEFMRDFAPVDTPVPARDYSALRVGQLDSWSSLQTPMVPVALEGLPASSSGLVNYSPLAPMFTFG